MNYTTNFNLNKPEGTDLYNHLTVDNPNMDTIDAQMQANKLASIGAATELVSGTVHAITRSDSNQNIFKFKATGNFNAGDTITVDGVSVNAYTTGGQQLLDDAYVLSTEVICVLDGTSLWVLVNKTPEASEIPYDANDTVKEKIEDMEDNTLSFNLNSPTGIVTSITGNATRYGRIVEVNLELTLSNGTYSDWFNIGTITPKPVNNCVIVTGNDGVDDTTNLRVLISNINGGIRIFNGNGRDYRIHMMYICE